MYTLEGVFCAEIYPKLNRARGMTEIGFVGPHFGGPSQVHLERSRDQFNGGRVGQKEFWGATTPCVHREEGSGQDKAEGWWRVWG